MLKKFVLLLHFLHIATVHAEGFVAGTLIKTTNGFVPIENIQINDYVVCYDCNNNCMVAKPVLFLTKKSVSSHVCVHLDNVCLAVNGNQQFYDAKNHDWVRISDLSIGDLVSTANGKVCTIKHIEHKNEPIDLYCLYIKNCHNFCVTSSEVIVHNFIPIVAAVVWAFGTGGIELVSWGIGFAGGSLIGYSLYKKHQQAQKGGTISITASGGGFFPGGPDDDEDKLTLEQKKIERDKLREKHRPLTNKEARVEAKKMGYREVKDHPCGNTRGKPVFYNDKEYISPDINGHSGGAWKVFNTKGILRYTMDLELQSIHRTYS